MLDQANVRRTILLRLRIIGLVAGIFVVAIGLWFYMVATVGVDPHTKLEIIDRDFLTATFFAIQTVTTTGYGSGFDMNRNVKICACFGMILGAISWGAFVGELAAFFATYLPSVPSKKVSSIEPTP